MRVFETAAVVSNGTHTDSIFDELRSGAEPEVALRKVLTEMGYEKDELSTPRIAGVVAGATGFLGIARVDGVEVARFGLEENSCRLICTYEIDRVETRGYPFLATSPLDAARYMVDGGVFRGFEKPICSAAWMDGFAVHNPHT